MPTITIHFSSNADLNSLLTLADAAYNAGNLANFDSAMDLLERHFYGLSLIPSCYDSTRKKLEATHTVV